MRGLGRVFRQRFTDRNGKRRTCQTYRLEFSHCGHVFREPTRTRSRSEALLVLRQRRDEVQRIAAPEQVLFEDLETMLLTNHKLNNRPSIGRVRFALKHLRKEFGGLRAVDISTQRVNEYIEKRTKESAAPATINVELAELSRMFTLAIRAETLFKKPVITKLRADNARRGFFTKAELQAVLEHLPRDIGRVVEVAFITGWRLKSEILTRGPQHADLQTGWLRCDAGETKNKAGRNFALTARLRAILSEQVAENEKTAMAQKKPVQWLFNRNGAPIKDFRRVWKTACKKAGLAGKQPHDLRRTAVRNLEIAGVPRSSAMEVVGHKTQAIYQRYAIVDRAMMVDASRKLDELHSQI